jgi:hypothetical protein
MTGTGGCRVGAAKSFATRVAQPRYHEKRQGHRRKLLHLTEVMRLHGEYVKAQPALQASEMGWLVSRARSMPPKPGSLIPGGCRAIDTTKPNY